MAHRRRRRAVVSFVVVVFFSPYYYHGGVTVDVIVRCSCSSDRCSAVSVIISSILIRHFAPRQIFSEGFAR